MIKLVLIHYKICQEAKLRIIVELCKRRSNYFIAISKEIDKKSEGVISVLVEKLSVLENMEKEFSEKVFQK